MKILRSHHKCNLNLSLSKNIPIVFQNLQNYNSHHIFQEIRKKNFKINVIPKAIEKYVNFTIHQPKQKELKPGLPLVFIDSKHFLIIN